MIYDQASVSYVSLNLTDGIVCILRPDNNTAGTGFVVSCDGLIVTCAHVVKSAKAEPGGTVFLKFYAAKTEENQRAVVEAKYWRDPDKGEDVAILRLQGSLPKRVVPLPLGSSFHLDNHTFSSFGFPKLDPSKGMWSAGEVLGLKIQGNFPVLQLRSQEVTQGFSGAPVWDNTSQVVIGMVTSSVENKEVKIGSYTFALPSDQNWRFLYTAFATPTETLREVCPLLQISSECPYRHLVAFTEADARFFCGRESFVETLLNRLHDSPRFLAVFGPSGSGKSSVVQAGLIPKLREGALLGSGNWEMSIIRPTGDPFQLAEETSPENSDNLTQRVGTWLEQHPEPTTRFVLVVDQFEELLASKDLKPSTFISRLTNLLDRSPRITLIIVMRDDFYSQFVGQEPLRQWLDNSRGAVNIPQTLTRRELEAIIREPAKRVNIHIQEGLVDLLIRDAIGEVEQEARSTILPLLEFTLTRLWEKRQDETLTLDAYNHMHGIKGEFTSWANITYDKLEAELPLEHRRFIQRIFMDLVYVGDEHLQLPNSRQRKTLTSLCRNARELKPIQEIVNKLVNARLLVESEAGIEIIHDVLLNEWDYLKKWINADRAFSLWHQKLEERIREWEGTNVEHAVKHDAHKLLRGNDLKEAKLWLTKRKADLDLQEQNFIKASSTRRIQFAMSMIVIFFMLVSTTGIAAWFYLTQPPDPTRVTTLQDNVNGSLRYCIKNASPGSTITFAQGMRGIIKLTGGDLVVERGKRLTVVGSGANQLAISGGNAIIHVSEDATLNISGLSFKNGRTIINGTAFLFNEGTLTMTHSIFSDNETLTRSSSSIGSAIENMGTLTVTDSIFSNNSAESQLNSSLGGSIYNGGTLTVTHSIFSNNSARGPDSRGGAIFNEGSLMVINSTFANNSASNATLALGGGIYNENKLIVIGSTFSNNLASGSRASGGGGIFTFEQFTKDEKVGGDHMGSLMVINSTFSNNSASGGGFGGGGIGIYNYSAGSGKGYSAIIRFCTLYGNTSSTGGGIWIDPTRDGHLTISSNIVAANRAHDGPDISGALISDGYNLIENFAGAKGLNARTDRQVMLADLKMDSTLGNNGGLTQTLALLQGSPAIDAVPGEACRITITDVSGHTVTITTDQRGEPRPDGSENACDTGAFESSY